MVMGTIGSLFSGIGGLDLGLERAGLGRTSWQVEADPFARSILARHWPTVPIHCDVRTVGAHNLEPVEVICGGFPCQDNSGANHNASGLDGERSGLAFHGLRIIRELRPRVAILENVDGKAFRRWVPQLRRHLWGFGYASVPLRVRACDVGAPFRGARIFLVATPYRDSESTGAFYGEVARLPAFAAAVQADWGRPTPRALGVADGVAHRVDRIRCCGNAVVPAMAEAVGRTVREAMRRSR